jgi:hypothetical protein
MFAAFRVGGQRYYLGDRGVLIPEDSYVPEPAIAPALIPVSRGGKYGYANAAGDIVIDCQFDFGEKFNEGYAAVKKTVNGDSLTKWAKFYTPATTWLFPPFRTDCL